MIERMIEELIPAALHNERLDRIVALITDLSRSAAASLIAAGGASVDGSVCTSGKVRIAEGQSVLVDPSFAPQPQPLQPDESVEFEVLHVDEHVVVVNKPPGLVVHPAAGHSDGTLVNGLLARFPDLAGIGEAHRPGIVHRLDVGTSGLMVVARSDTAYRRLVSSLAQHEVGRIYRCLVWGVPAHRSGAVDAPIGRDQRDPLKMAVVVDGKSARTDYSTITTFETPASLSLLECRLHTGRTHQIRVHLAAIGHPVVGDATYGGVRSSLAAPRALLHAAELHFTHPVTQQPLAFSCVEPADMASVVDRLGAADGRH
jgi:23S rRNA pseudouridine1911/1915/1917 synthase